MFDKTIAMLKKIRQLLSLGQPKEKENETVAITCLYCEKLIAQSIDGEMVPSHIECYKAGNVPVPNAGWLCSQECATAFEVKYNVTFQRTKHGKVDYYEGEV